MVIGVMPKRSHGDNLVWFDDFGFDSKLNLCLIANNNTKNLLRVKAVAAYYKNIINSI